MVKCEKCGKETMSFTCRYCGGKYCSAHRLPENHDCNDLEEGVEKEREESGRWFREKKVRDELRPPEPAKQSLARDLLDNFTSNVTLMIISLTLFTFLLQALPGFRELLTLSPAITQAQIEAVNQAFQFRVLDSTLLQKPWTIVTVMLVHGGFFHLFANMVTFYFFGTPLERMIGGRELLKFYVGSGIAASLGFVIFRNLLYTLYGPVIAGLPTLGAAVGASGAVVAVFAVIAEVYPDAEVLLYFFIPMKIRTALYLFAGIEGVNLLTKLVGMTLPVIGNFASSAHLTGLVLGVWYGRRLREKVSTRQGVLDLLGY